MRKSVASIIQYKYTNSKTPPPSQGESLQVIAIPRLPPPPPAPRDSKPGTNCSQPCGLGEESYPRCSGEKGDCTS